jgi:FtsP/CotA-like multicopper oxidase with cupredoxin domain
MSRKDRDDSIWLSEHSDKRRIRDAENARQNRAEITKALSHGQIRRRDLVKWGLFTSAGIMLPIGGLNPFVRSLHGQTTTLSPSAVLASSSDNQGIPTGLPASPTFGVQPFTQPMPRFDVLARNAVSTLNPAPTAQSNQTQQVLDPGFGFPAGTTGPIEGRPPGANWAHQRFAQFPPQVAIEVTTKPVTTNTTYNPAVTSDLNSGINPASPIPAKFHPSFPTQNANRVWTFQGTFPPKLTQVRYGEPVLFRHHNGLTTDIRNNGGFGRYTLTTHEHNAHHGAENDGFTGAYFWPNQFYDYHYPWVLAGFTTINTGATDPRAGAPNDAGGINKVPGDWHETMSTHWFHDHMFTFTDQNVYKCNAGMNNIYSSLDRGDETVNDGVNLRLPSGSSNGKGWGNLDFDVNLMLSDKAWDANGQLNMDTIAFDGFLGDQMTVNFAWKPFFNVYARRYRFRILNASVSRFFVLALSDSSRFVQIANDGNLLPVTVPLTQTDQLGIAERYDIVIDFSRYSAGQTVDLVNLQVHQDGRGPANIVTVAQALAGTSDPAVGRFLRFKVLGPPPHPDQSVNLTANPRTALIPNPTLPTTVRQRTFQFNDNGSQNQNDPVTTYLGNGGGVGPWGIETNNSGGSSSLITASDTGGSLQADYGRISSQPGFGTAEVWTLQGGSGWDHPIHIHFEEGQILNRNGNPPSPAESGRKDVYRLRDNGSVTIKMQFRDWGGMFMEHCHNTMHEDNAMLLRWDLDSGKPFLSPLPTPISKPTGVTFQAPDEILPNA